MDLDVARSLALDLMAEHALTDWSFAFDDATRRMGQCQYASRRITMSWRYAQHADEAHVRDTILHEIAHALTPGAKHGLRWKVMAQKLGTSPKACADNPFADSDGEVAKRLAAVEGKPFMRVVSAEHGDKRYRILRENQKTYKLIDEDGGEMLAHKSLVYPEGQTAPTREEARSQERQRNLAAVAGRPVYRVEHRAYEGKRFAILREGNVRTRHLLVNLESGQTLRAPRSMVKPVSRQELHAMR